MFFIKATFHANTMQSHMDRYQNTMLTSVKQTITINPFFFSQNKMGSFKSTAGNHCARISTNIPQFIFLRSKVCVTVHTHPYPCHIEQTGLRPVLSHLYI